MSTFDVFVHGVHGTIGPCSCDTIVFSRLKIVELCARTMQSFSVILAYFIFWRWSRACSQKVPTLPYHPGATCIRTESSSLLPRDSLRRRANARNIDFRIFYGGQFTLSTHSPRQLIKPNYPAQVTSFILINNCHFQGKCLEYLPLHICDWIGRVLLLATVSGSRK